MYITTPMVRLDNRDAMQIILAIAVVLILYAIVSSRSENMTNKKLTKLMHEGYIPIGNSEGYIPIGNSEGLCAGVNEETLHRSLATGTVLNRRDNYVVIDDNNNIEGYCGGQSDCKCGTSACKCGAGPGCGCEVGPCGCVGACKCGDSGNEFRSSTDARLSGATSGIVSDSAGLRNAMTKLISSEGFNENSLHNTEVDAERHHTEGYAGVLASGLLSPMPLSQDDAALRMLL